jgi:hypothetical protein
MFEDLTIDSMLCDLPAHDRQVAGTMLGRDVLSVFERDIHLPGVLVMDGARLVGIVSRETFFERTGRVFGPEVFLSRPIATMLETIPYAPLVLPDTTLITLATQQVLQRDRAAIYQPVVSETAQGEFRLISALILFMAQSHQLTALHRQRMFTVDAGQALSDDEAARQFVAFARLNGGFDLARCFVRHSTRCDHCGQAISYSVVDIVRAYPQLIKGITLEEAMGTRSYRFYVRHQCGNEIWEVPVQHDANLEYRSQRPARLVETYA